MNNSLNISKRKIDTSPTKFKQNDLSTEWKIPIKIWIFISCFCIFDMYISSYFLRMFTAFIIPQWLANILELGFLVLALFNVVVYFFFTIFTFSMPFVSNVSKNFNGEKPKSNFVPIKVGLKYNSTFDKLFQHFSIKTRGASSNTSVSPKQIPVLQIQNNFIKSGLNHSRNSLHSSDIFTDEQLYSIQNDNPAAFTVKYSKSDLSNRYSYQIDNRNDIQINDNSRVDDLLDISQNTSELFPSDTLTTEKSEKMLGISGLNRSKHRLDSTSSFKLANRKSFSLKKDMSRSTLFSNVSPQPMIISTEELYQEFKLKSQDTIFIEENIRRFIGANIIKPLYKAVTVANAEISRGSSSLRVGTSSISDLQELVAREQNLIPYVAPIFHYFSIVKEQEHLLNKLEKWAHSDMIYGFDPEAQKTSLIDWPDMSYNRSITRLPTESELILRLFAAYMDCQISTVPINRLHEHGKTFNSIYLIDSKRLKKEQPISSYFIEILDDLSTTAFCFHAKVPNPIVTTKTTNCITVISCLIAQTHFYNDRIIYGLDLSDIGLDIDTLMS